MEGLITALGTAFNGVSANVMDIIEVALPVGVGIVAAIFAIKYGIRFFKSIAKG